MNTTTITSSPFEKLFYRLSTAPDQLALAAETLQIPSVAKDGTEKYWELIRCASARRMELEQISLQNQILNH